MATLIYRPAWFCVTGYGIRRSTVPTGLHDPEPAGHVRPVGERGVRGRVRSAAVEVGEGRRLVDEDSSGQIGRKVYPDVEGGLFSGVEHLLVRGVDRCRQRIP